VAHKTARRRSCCGCGSVPRRSGLCVAGALGCTTACLLRAPAARASLCAAGTRGHSACLLRAGPSVAAEAPPTRRRFLPLSSAAKTPHGTSINVSSITSIHMLLAICLGDFAHRCRRRQPLPARYVLALKSSTRTPQRHDGFADSQTPKCAFTSVEKIRTGGFTLHLSSLLTPVMENSQ
jgi:hypothetical protein